MCLFDFIGRVCPSGIRTSDERAGWFCKMAIIVTAFNSINILFKYLNLVWRFANDQ